MAAADLRRTFGLEGAPLDPVVVNQLSELIGNAMTARSDLFRQLFDPRRDIDSDCGYPSSESGFGFGSINPEFYRALYERECIATRVVQLMPYESWAVSPLVYEDESADVVTEFEEAWDTLGQDLRGEASWYVSEQGSPVWEHLRRADVLSGIGHFGVLLLGIDDGLNLDQPAVGVSTTDPSGRVRMGGDDAPRDLASGNEPSSDRRENRVSATKSSTSDYLGTRPSPGGRFGGSTNVSNSGGVVNERILVFMGQGYKPIFNASADVECPTKTLNHRPVYRRNEWGMPAIVGTEEVTSDVTPLAANATDGAAFNAPSSLDWGRDNSPSTPSSSGSGFDAMGHAVVSSGGLGTDAQYVGIQLSPPEYPAEKKAGSDGKAPRRRLLFVRAYDESLVQIVQYEANVRNPRFGMPVMYRITLNDPREMHSGIGLPMATVRVHWSRVIHLADNRGSSEIFGVPRMRPVLNRLLDLRKLYAGSAEMYWRGAFPGYALSTHPQLGGDVRVDWAGVKDTMEQYMNGLQRYMGFMGLSAESLAPQVVDPTPQITIQLEAVCIQLACPVRVFKGSERGELASGQDDDKWNDRIRERQNNYLTPRIVVPFVDRLITMGVLPVPKTLPGAEEEHADVDVGAAAKAAATAPGGAGGKLGGAPGGPPGVGGAKPPAPGGTPGASAPPTGNARPYRGVRRYRIERVERIVGWRLVRNAGGDLVYNADGDPIKEPILKGSTKITTDGGYTVEWPDLDSLGAKDKAAIALQKTQAISAYVAGGCEALVPPVDYFTEVLGMPEERARQLVEDAKAHQAETMTMPAEGEQGHPATAEPEKPPPPTPLVFDEDGSPIDLGDKAVPGAKPFQLGQQPPAFGGNPLAPGTPAPPGKPGANPFGATSAQPSKGTEEPR